MGLAAGQARFLAITARKMNCEFQSMQVAQEKLSTTRDLQRAAAEYQNSLDATKLVWDTDGRADGVGDVYELSYDVMMRPSILNNFTPHFVTDTKGRIVLSKAMFEAARDAGVIKENGDPNTDMYKKPFMGEATSTDDGSRNALLYQLSQKNQIDGEMMTNIIKLGKDGYTRAGIGGPIFDKSTANVLDTNLFINYMKTATDEGTIKIEPNHQYGYYVSNSEGTGYEAKPSDKNSTTSNENIRVFHYSAGDTISQDVYYQLPENSTATTTGTINGTTYYMNQTLPQDCQFKKGDVAPFDFTVAVKTANSVEGLIYGINDAFKNVLGETNNVQSTSLDKMNSSGSFTVTKGGQSLSNNDLRKLTVGDLLTGQYELTYNGSDYENKFKEVLETIATALGYGDVTHIRGLNVDAESNEALKLAYDYTAKLISKDNQTYENTVDPAILASKSKEKTNIVKSSSKDISSISLSNLAAAYLTNFARAIDGLGTSYYVDDKTVKDSRMVTKNADYSFIVANNGAMTDEIDLNADFYNMFYNVLATTGACTEDMLINEVTEKSYLQESIKNGRLFVSSLNSDGYFYQGAYGLTNYIAEVTDEEAIARAEREYEVTKSRLNTKEETLDLKMKNLDMEISSLTTEFDTVKNLISKNIEKVFTMFSN